MNIIIALEQLGYINQTDFLVDWDEFSNSFTIQEWNHTDPQPNQVSLDAAWADWLVDNPELTLTDIKDEAKLIVDQTAESTRLKYITSGSGQAMTYIVKAEEAADYITAGYPVNLTPYLFIQAEVNATGKTNIQAADDIIATKALWKTIGAQIEEVRIFGKINIDGQSDEVGIAAARDHTISDLNAI